MKSDLHIIWSLFSSSSRLQKKRAYLTIAAIAWGTVAILLLLAFGEGLKRQLDKNRRSTAENFAVMWPSETTKPWKGLPPGRPIRPRIDDLDFISERMPELKSVIGEVVSWRTAISYGKKTVNGRVIGTNYVFGDARKHYPVAGGRWLSPEDEAKRRRVIFLGDEMAKDIFGQEDPVGKTVLVNNAPYTVIGVMQHKTQMGVYGGTGRESRVHPDLHVPRTVRPREAEHSRHRDVETGTDDGRAQETERGAGAEVRLRPDRRACAADVGHGQGREGDRPTSPSASSSSSASSAR